MGKRTTPVTANPKRHRMADRERGDDPERLTHVARAIDRRERDQEQDVVHRLDVDDVAESELDVRRQLAHWASDAAVDAAGCSARARANSSPAALSSPSERSITRGVVEELRVARALRERVRHRRLRLDVATLRVERPRQQVVPVDVAARPQLDEHLAIHAGDVTMMVEQEETPSAVVCARLLQYGDVQRPRVLAGLRAVADRGVGVAQHAERRRVERSGDRLLAGGDRIPPFVPRGGEPRRRGEESIVTGMGGEPRAVFGIGLRVLAAPQIEVAVAKPEPGDLLAGKVRRRERRLERRAHEPARFAGAPFDLGPARETRGHREVVRVAAEAVERHTRRVVLPQLHLDLADGGAERGNVGVAVAQRSRDRQRFVEPVLREEARREHLRGGVVARVAVANGSPRGGFGAERVARVAGLARPLQVETGQARQVRRAGGIAVGALFVELYIQVENFALAETGRGRGRS